MIRSNIRLATVLMTCAALLGAGCAAAGVDSPPRDRPDPMVMTDGPRLEVVGPATRTLMPGEEHEILVRYEEANGTPIAREAVEFAIAGDAQGATLSGRA